MIMSLPICARRYATAFVSSSRAVIGESVISHDTPVPPEWYVQLLCSRLRSAPTSCAGPSARQRRISFQAWGNAPGGPSPPSRALKARFIARRPELRLQRGGLVCLHILGRCPSLVLKSRPWRSADQPRDAKRFTRTVQRRLREPMSSASGALRSSTEQQCVRPDT
jgi:hypothetical protein